MDLLLTAPASRSKGLEFIVKSEKGEHLSMDLLQLHKVRFVATVSPRESPLLSVISCCHGTVLRSLTEPCALGPEARHFGGFWQPLVGCKLIWHGSAI